MSEAQRPASSFANVTRVEGGDGRYTGTLSPEWWVWGPVGGAIATLALRAIGAEATLRRPASLTTQFLAFAKPGPVEIEVETLRRGRRSQALRALIRQDDQPVLSALGWVADDALLGFEHEHVQMPDVPPAESLRSYAEIADNYAEWFPVWRHIDGRPVIDDDQPGPPVWHTWMRLSEPSPGDDPFVDAGRSLMWMDLMMWNAAVGPHRPWPLRYIAPNLDVSVLFHRFVPEVEWLLCDGHAPVAREGLVGCTGRLWAPDGRLVASGTSQLLCVPNARFEEQLASKHAREVTGADGD